MAGLGGCKACLVAAACVLAATGCQFDDQRCGPKKAVVERIVDGDTIVLDSGEKIRYLMIDTPELSDGGECFSGEARDFNSDAVLGKEITLEYDTECTDRFGRLLAYIYVDGREINTLMVERGYACVLHISPNGDERVVEFETLESQARSEGRGLWACEDTPC